MQKKGYQDGFICHGVADLLRTTTTLLTFLTVTMATQVKSLLNISLMMITWPNDNPSEQEI